jgi:Zn-dependent peptidase ImmA (M78 family)
MFRFGLYGRPVVNEIKEPTEGEWTSIETTTNEGCVVWARESANVYANCRRPPMILYVDSLFNDVAEIMNLPRPERNYVKLHELLLTVNRLFSSFR